MKNPRSCAIVWDEAPTSQGFRLIVVDRLLKDIIRSEVSSFSGDFRQILPVVAHGARSGIVAACIKSKHLWPTTQRLHLARDMRADGDEEFAAWLLLLDDGAIEGRREEDEDAIGIPPRFVC